MAIGKAEPKLFGFQKTKLSVKRACLLVKLRLEPRVPKGSPFDFYGPPRFTLRQRITTLPVAQT